MEEKELEIYNKEKEIINPKNTNGRCKNYKLVIATLTDYEEEEYLIVEGTEWGYFDTIEEIKSYLTGEKKKEIIECFSGANDISFEVCSVNKPFDNKILEKRFLSEREEGTFFCPYCGKWRFSVMDEETNTEKCSICGVSTNNYDVKLWKYRR